MRGDWVWWQRSTCRQFAQVKQMHRFDEASCCSTCPASQCPSPGSQIVNQHSIEQEVGTIAELLLVSTADTTPASPADLLPHFFRGQCVLDHTSAKVSSPPPSRALSQQQTLHRYMAVVACSADLAGCT